MNRAGILKNIAIKQMTKRSIHYICILASFCSEDEGKINVLKI
jgi:hypothetical protein